MSSGPENMFRKQLVARLKALFGRAVYIQKNHGSAFSAGLVDMEVVLRQPDGGAKVGFYELKASDGPFNPQCVTALQRFTLNAIWEAGGGAWVLHYNTTTRAVARYSARSLVDPHPTPTTTGTLTTGFQDAVTARVMLDL